MKHHLLLCLVGLALISRPSAAASDPQKLASDVLRVSGVGGGLILHVGCGDGKLTAALHANEGCLVHGLDADAKNIAAARQHIHSLGLYGKVSAERWTGRRLPCIDNLVNLVVVSGDTTVDRDELLRVLAPNGVAFFANQKSEIGNRKLTKPRPEQIDEWTHFLHGPDNNPVARDTEIDFPQHLQWIGDPNHSRSHQFLTSISAMVSAGGRLFYIVDEGSTWLQDFLPSAWQLCARDAFNGVVLWKRPITSWQPASQRGRIPFAPDLFRRLVAVGDRVYATMSIFGPVSALDAATGKTLRTFANSDNTEELIVDGGVLYCIVSLADPAGVDRRELAVRRAEPAKKRLVAIRAETGEALWSKEDADTASYLPLTLIAQGKRVLVQNTEAIVCLDAANGRPVWRHPQTSLYAREAWSTPTLVIADDVVLSADRAGAGERGKKGRVNAGNAQLTALSADTGKVLWQCPCAEGHTSSPEVFVANGQVWVGESKAHKTLDWRTSRDLHTGKVVREFGETEGWPDWHHHRCYREKATTRFLLSSRTGVEFTDMVSGTLTPHNWIRGICRYGILPCNGLIYLPPDQCACYIESKLHGFNALAPARKAVEGRGTRDEGKASGQERLERGPAYEAVANRNSQFANPQDWPTFRHDAARSGATAAPVGRDLKPQWSVQLGGKLTALVCADGKLYVAHPETHAIVCLDAASGQMLWRYTTGGRIDSPPTLARGLAVFGCQDGFVYALRADDGQLAWRFLAAPDDQRLVAHGQLESVWPVPGSTLVENDKVYVASGRNSYFDGGVSLYLLDLATGKPVLSRRFYSRDPNTGKSIDLFKRYAGAVLPDREMPGLLPDVFASDGESLYLRSVSMTRDFNLIGAGKPHLFCSMGFLDDGSWERTYWMYGTHMYSGARGWGHAQTIEPAGKLMVFDAETVYAFDDASSRMGLSLYAAAKQPARNEGANPSKARRVTRRMKEAGKGKAGEKSGDEDADVGGGTAAYAHQWRRASPLNVRAMVLAGDTLFVAGPPRFDEAATLAALQAARIDDARLSPLLADAQASVAGRKGAVLCALNKNDGKDIATLKLESAPVFDGLIAAGGKLYLSTLDGRVLCLGASGNE